MVDKLFTKKQYDRMKLEAFNGNIEVDGTKTEIGGDLEVDGDLFVSGKITSGGSLYAHQLLVFDEVNNVFGVGFIIINNDSQNYENKTLAWIKENVLNISGQQTYSLIATGSFKSSSSSVPARDIYISNFGWNINGVLGSTPKSYTIDETTPIANDQVVKIL